jgi:ribose transport system permease protein
MSETETVLKAPLAQDRGGGTRSRPAGTVRTTILRHGVRYAMLWILAALVIAAQLAYSNFLTVDNVKNLLTQNAELGIVAMGMTLVVIGGGFDLSVTGTFSFGAVFFAGLCANSQWSWVVALIAVIVVGALFGLVNGLVVTWLNVNAFITTLGTAVAYGGLAAMYSHSSPIPVYDVPGFDALGTGKLLGIPVPIVLLVVLYAIGGVVLAKSAYGRKLYAVGGNLHAARLAGLRIDRIRIVSFVACGLLTAFAGAMLASTLSTGQTDQIPTIALDAIAAVVIGGTSLYGGEGAMWRTAVGVLILATINNLFSSLAVETPVQNVIKGAVVIAAVALETYTRSQGTSWGTGRRDAGEAVTSIPAGASAGGSAGGEE